MWGPWEKARRVSNVLLAEKSDIFRGIAQQKARARERANSNCPVVEVVVRARNNGEARDRNGVVARPKVLEEKEEVILEILEVSPEKEKAS